MTVGVSEDGRSKQRSFTVHGDEWEACERQAELLQAYGVRRALPGWEGERLTVGVLLGRFVAAPHAWSPATVVSHAHMASKVRRDGLARCRLDRLTPTVVQAAMSRWADGGASVAMISGRYAVLHAAISWAIAERMLRFDPLVGMRAPPRPYPRRHLPPELVSRLIVTAERRREKAAAGLAEHPGSHGAQLRLFRADQDVLMVRLVADAGLRRGELAGLRTDDLDGRVLLIERAAKGKVIGPTKTHRRGRITLGATVTQVWIDHVAVWQTYPPTDAGTGPWLFTTDLSRTTPLTPSGLRQRFDKIVKAADVPGACLHRIRHTVGTYLVGQGKILKAAGRLRHRDPSTTLRNYADALPLDDEDAADLLDDLYRDPSLTRQPDPSVN